MVQIDTASVQTRSTTCKVSVIARHSRCPLRVAADIAAQTSKLSSEHYLASLKASIRSFTLGSTPVKLTGGAHSLHRLSSSPHQPQRRIFPSASPYALYFYFSDHAPVSIGALTLVPRRDRLTPTLMSMSMSMSAPNPHSHQSHPCWPRAHFLYFNSHTPKVPRSVSTSDFLGAQCVHSS